MDLDVKYDTVCKSALVWNQFYVLVQLLTVYVKKEILK